jgi:hypothetical protein
MNTARLVEERQAKTLTTQRGWTCQGSLRLLITGQEFRHEARLVPRPRPIGS